MAYAMYKRLKRALKNAGIKYVIVEGAENRGHGALGTIQSIMAHHTAGGPRGDHPSLNVVTNGRVGLSGPLAQFLLSRNGTGYLVAAGRAYHAGRVSSTRYQNSHSIGIEAEATGVDEWPDEQIEAYAKLCKALIKEFNLPVSRVVGHKEAAVPRGRKIDPNFNMDDFRGKVAGAKGGVSIDTGGGGGGNTYTVVSKTAPLGLYDKDGNGHTRIEDWQTDALGYDEKAADGYFGPDTKSDTIKMQKQLGVTADGLVGEDTMKAWLDAGKPKLSESKPSKPKPSKGEKFTPSRTYAFPYEKGGYIGPLDGPNRSHSGIGGRKTNGVYDRTHNKRFVNVLIERGWDARKGGDYLTKYGNDGKYGAELEALIRAFQRDQGLDVDGLAGKSTWNAAFTNPVT